MFEKFPLWFYGLDLMQERVTKEKDRPDIQDELKKEMIEETSSRRKFLKIGLSSTMATVLLASGVAVTISGCGGGGGSSSGTATGTGTGTGSSTGTGT